MDEIEKLKEENKDYEEAFNDLSNDLGLVVGQREKLKKQIKKLKSKHHHKTFSDEEIDFISCLLTELKTDIKSNNTSRLKSIKGFIELNELSILDNFEPFIDTLQLKLITKTTKEENAYNMNKNQKIKTLTIIDEAIKKSKKTLSGKELSEITNLSYLTIKKYFDYKTQSIRKEFQKLL